MEEKEKAQGEPRRLAEESVAHAPEALTGSWNTKLNMQNGGVKGNGVIMVKHIRETDLGQHSDIRFLLMSDNCLHSPIFFPKSSLLISSEWENVGNDTAKFNLMLKDLP